MNKLITSYRSTSYDPYAVEVSEWDVPLWWAERDGLWVRIGLMPYWDSDEYPNLGKFGTTEKTLVAATSVDAIQAQAMESVAAGKLELLDALSLSYRGRFGDAIRSAVTAIEVALEAQLAKLLKEKGRTDEQIQRRLGETRNSFVDRLAEFEKESRRRLPGPLLSIIPYINGVRLKEELDWVRELRHKVVHEGTRIDVSESRSMSRAMETMTWLFDWLSWDDAHRSQAGIHNVWFGAMRGRQMLPFSYTDSGVVVVALQNQDDDDADSKTADQLVFEQYLKTIAPEVDDIDLFAKMSFVQLGIMGDDAPPEIIGDPIARERFHVSCNGVKALVFCLDLDGLIDMSVIGRISLRLLAHNRSHGSGWSVLCVINHQRHLPVELREVEKAIADDVDQVARECGLTLITAPDLRFLLQGIVQYQWEVDPVRNLLLMSGRQGLVPPIYRQIGSYRRFFDNHSVMIVQLAEGETIAIGAIIAVRLAGRYHEEKVDSLRVDLVAVDTASGPCKISIKTKLRKSDLKHGQSVYARSSGSVSGDSQSTHASTDSVGEQESGDHADGDGSKTTAS